ncbi:hypothetical protein RJ640_021751 [Escallonia rubra]|uniref:Reverse transcriptase Ty1/copia-type domain-containing protein n=1 Tax=Escallonia rubra TaxID=112253 RepID=A0AA88R044_9ASTE|nr:hypothetical protein RJ640_021751 [Escallonia rubra]
MVTLKYSGSSGVREHILRLNDMPSQLKGLDMEISKGFLVHFITTSLPAQFGPFKINYNTQEEKSKMSKLIFMCVQEKERLKSEQPDSAHVAITGPSKGKGKGNKFGKSSMQGNKSASVTKTNKASSSGPNCHFCRAKRHMRKECQKFRKWSGKERIHFCEEAKSRRVNVEKAQVEAVRTPRLVLESAFNLDLLDTVYVPNMTRNLIFVSRHDAYGYSFKFENKAFSLFLYFRVIGSGLLEGNLYKLLLNASFTESLKTMNVNDVVTKTCDAEYSGSSTLRIINLEKIQDHVSIHVIQKNFDMKDLGEASYGIGIEIHRDRSRGILRLSQRVYIDKVLKRFNMHNGTPTVAHVVKGDKFGLLQCPRKQLEQDEIERIPYASTIGNFMYAQVCTHPDIYSVCSWHAWTLANKPRNWSMESSQESHALLTRYQGFHAYLYEVR